MKASIAFIGSCLVCYSQAFVARFPNPMQCSSIQHHMVSSSAEDDAKALMERVKKIREEIASLEGRSISEVEEEAEEKSRLKKERDDKEVAERFERTKAPKTPVSNGRFLTVPEVFDDQVQQAADAVKRAFKDGTSRQVVRFALLPEDETLNERERLWPGGAQQMYREAAGPLTRGLVKAVCTTEDFRRPNVTSQDIWDFDGSALVTAECPSGPQGDVQALVFPNTDNKYSMDIKKIDAAMGDRLFLLVNPFWRDIESWGFNLLAPKAKELAQEAIFGRGFEETYVLLEKSVRGEDCIALKAYPYDWQLYAYAETEYWPFDATIVHLGTTKNEPNSKEFAELLNERDEFKLSKNMRYMQRMMNRKDD